MYKRQILAFASLYVMSLFVWDIDFAGNMRYTDSYLLQFVKNEGYKPGMKISNVACDRLEKRLRNEFDDITLSLIHILLLPNTGTPLPFISAGMSSLISTYIMMGIMLNISMHRKMKVF